MTVRIRVARLRDKPVLATLFGPYRAELEPLGAGDAEIYPAFDLYWIEPDRWPYLIEQDGEAVGLAMVNAASISGRPADFSMAEFYVSPQHRRGGVGGQAAALLFAAHHGQWELSILRGNVAAAAFWARTIAAVGAEGLEAIDRSEEWLCRFRVGWGAH